MPHTETIYIVEKFIEESKQYLEIGQEMNMADHSESEEHSNAPKRRFS